MVKDHLKISGGRRSFTPLSEEEIFELVRHKVEVEKRFLDTCLNRESLAEEINVHRNLLSAAVNRFAGVSFTVWVASYRIAEVERLAAMPENGDSSIASLALRAGFTKRETFNRVYTAIKGSKPSETLPGRKNKTNKIKN